MNKDTGCGSPATSGKRLGAKCCIANLGELRGMSVLWKGSGVERLSTAILALSALAVLTALAASHWASPDGPRDFEECAEQAQSALGAERTAQTTECGARFAGRRKAGGGYTYFDFMQNRIFDIAGPNPTAEERGYIDSEYMRFLDSERSDALSAELAQRQAEKLVAGLESTLTVGAALRVGFWGAS